MNCDFDDNFFDAFNDIYADDMGMFEVKLPNGNHAVIIDNMDGTVSVDLFGIKDTGKGYGSKIIEEAIKKYPNHKIRVDTDLRGNSPTFFNKMRDKFKGRFIFEDESLLK